MATVQDVLNDLTSLTNQATALDKTIRAFPETGGSLTNALEIHSDTTKTQADIDKATAHVKAVPTPVSIADATSVLKAVNVAKPIIENGLKMIVNRKPVAQALGVPDLIKQDLTNLKNSYNTLADALIASTPPEMSGQAKSIKLDVDKAFSTAVAAYN